MFCLCCCRTRNEGAPASPDPAPARGGRTFVPRPLRRGDRSISLPEFRLASSLDRLTEIKALPGAGIAVVRRDMQRMEEIRRKGLDPLSGVRYESGDPVRVVVIPKFPKR
ncbi:MAG: hypothetical protein OXF02_05280 [Simkaniaceae bacterium]|nr:hypothetical protein [Simkaniaceae bacterium]